MASAFHAIARSPVKRAVHLQISPRPASIAESSEIMRVMSRFGEIEHYKNFKYDTLSSPKTAVVIFREEDAAINCLRQSPIRFHMSRGPQPREVTTEFRTSSMRRPFTNSDVTKAGIDSNRPQPASKANPFGSWGLGVDFSPEPLPRYHRNSTLDKAIAELQPEKELQTPEIMLQQAEIDDQSTEISIGKSIKRSEEQERDSDVKAFTVLTSPAHINFREHINNSRLANGFAIDTKTAAQRDLAGRVPHLGLSDLDWRTEISWRHVERAKRIDREDPNRKTLRQLYNEGVAEGHDDLKLKHGLTGGVK